MDKDNDKDNDNNDKTDHASPREHQSDDVQEITGSLMTGESYQKQQSVEQPAPEPAFKQPDPEPEPEPELTLHQALEGVDRYLQVLSVTNHKTADPPEVPNAVESLIKMVEEMVSNYSVKAKFGQNQEEDSSFTESLSRITKMLNLLREFDSHSTSGSSINRATTVLHQAMTMLDTEMYSILESCHHKGGNVDPKTPKATKQPNDQNPQESEPKEEEEYPSFSPEQIAGLNRIANIMISSGYENDCCLLYNAMRRKTFLNELEKLGFENISMEDVHKMQWEAMEGEIATWINVMKHCSTVFLRGERKLSLSVFADYPSISKRLFGDLAAAVIIRFLNFAEAITLTKRSAERLFKFLDMYETVRDLDPGIDDSYSIETAEELKSETWAAKSRLGEAAVSIFCDLENSIKRDNGRTPVPSGAVHPLTRYTMNYLKYACEYKDTLEEVFKQHLRMDESSDSNVQHSETKEGNPRDDGKSETSRFGGQLNKVMDLLEENLDMKSKLYRDASLRYVFLMNNGRYILQKIKGSNEIYEMMGLTWCRKLSSELRMYHKSYTRETWSRLLQCLSLEGLQVHGKVAKPAVKERFKMFNTMFDEIHRTQSTWVVSDEQLQSELRVSVSAVVIPAYRSFLGRFQQYMTPGRQTEKYIKYQPEDIENSIEELFGGDPTSMARRRT
ncbi:hypothetical protein K2173_005840 [Erythroxylum novogranatense]|uniref:Exocyst subunit Exo70 family protein n=1 Tax=Erythroxylum novogranatense TaxID=1862640 RepID=A0AAV8U675_9ROSI|nr:hypothetical protein K2173_005840 [Erythroxylum novogranatense]